MTNRIIKSVIAADKLPVRTAATVRAALPGQWAVDADVPLYLYQPLKLILFPGFSDTEYENAIIEIYGIGATPEDRSVQISTLPFDQVNKSDGMQADTTGAEIALLKIMVQATENLTDADKYVTEQADLRIRMLLDYNCRSKRRRNGEPLVTPALSAAIDPTVINNIKQFPVITTWEGYIDNESAIAKASVYRHQYFRAIV